MTTFGSIKARAREQFHAQFSPVEGMEGGVIPYLERGARINAFLDALADEVREATLEEAEGILQKEMDSVKEVLGDEDPGITERIKSNIHATYLHLKEVRSALRAARTGSGERAEHDWAFCASRELYGTPHSVVFECPCKCHKRESLWSCAEHTKKKDCPAWERDRLAFRYSRDNGCIVSHD